MSETLSIQAYAYVIVVDDAGSITAVTKNVETIVGASAETLIGQPATVLFSPSTLGAARHMIKQLEIAEIQLTEREPVDWDHKQVIAHHTDNLLVLEVEPRTRMEIDFPHGAALREINQAIIRATSTSELLQGVCSRIATYLKYDRVVIYHLEHDGSGVITEEYNNGVLPSINGLRYRQQDFPLEAHHLYRLESVHSYPFGNHAETTFVGDATEAAGMIRHCLGSRKVFDTIIRFVEEASLQGYLGIALWQDDELWGMIFGHAKQPVYLDHQLRNFAHLIGNLTSQALAYRAFNVAHRQLLATELIRTQVRENLATAPSLLAGLQRSDPSIMDLMPDTSGAAILLDGDLVTIGLTPPESTVRELLDWAKSQVASNDVFNTDHLASLVPTASDLTATAAGFLAIPLNIRCTEWIAWFRGEIAQKVIYGSRQNEGAEAGGKRFESTTEIRRGYSLPWSDENQDTARDLQHYIRDVIMERYGQLTRINHRLQVAYEELESFSYTVSHDLRAPLRGIDGFAEILMEDFGPQIDAEGQALIQVIQNNAARMNQFITDILELSRIGRVTLQVTVCDVAKMVRTAKKELENQFAFPLEIRIQKGLPPLRGDRRLLTMVFRHLLSNAFKYSAGQTEPIVEVGYRPANEYGDGEYFVRDNGIGIDKAHQERVFGMFNRLVTKEDYAGNGVGLAISRRILSRHNGEIRIESEAGRGATFLFNTDPNLSDASKLF
ncbi:light-regulated signal transduction histidine kinase (bacteriophytochrome) [Neolewinella xylanilytica]|uniref:histidine kinase n=1 Tax=Neolewinella xylanilytica TaxID=1514080 RepID=A0A2S6I929_9BACT|nr:ATP-binding protein [Neolewinella xylanilytica]PPK88007.1 light-regulated signal transduction histidine kinase (bacteriophytochrome) [Neolewinella xylanilytica]